MLIEFLTMMTGTGGGSGGAGSLVVVTKDDDVEVVVVALIDVGDTLGQMCTPFWSPLCRLAKRLGLL